MSQYVVSKWSCMDFLTEGKKYKIIRENDDGYFVNNDINEESFFTKDYFHEDKSFIKYNNIEYQVGEKISIENYEFFITEVNQAYEEIVITLLDDRLRVLHPFFVKKVFDVS